MAEEYNIEKAEFKSRKMLFSAVFALAVFIISFLLYRVYLGSDKKDNQAARGQENGLNESKNVKEIFDAEYAVKEGDTLSLILESLNIKAEERIKIIEAFEKIYSPAKIKTGNIFKIKYDKAKTAAEKIEYGINAEKILVLTKKAEKEWSAEEKEIIYDIKIASRGGKIKSSLFETGSEIGLDAGTILLMADVFSGEIDFASDIQEGDSFKIIYEEKYKDGVLAQDGNILAAEFQNQGKIFRAFYFEDKGNKSFYFNENGQSLKKAFLKSPLNYRYISSGYSNARFHPVLKIVTSHRAIDYVAAAGTPVVSVADGKVILAGWNSGGYGNYIGIRHANGYATYYGHLSAYAKGIRTGSQVAQGQIIGYVGATGFATGAHLDYSMKKNGFYLNPLNVNIVVGDPISEASRENFSVYAEKMIKSLEEIKM